MLESTNRYATASREFMGKAYQYLAENDLPQASEKGWGATAEMVKAIAEERGWPHRSHRLLFDVIDDLERKPATRNWLPCLSGRIPYTSTFTKTGCVPAPSAAPCKPFSNCSPSWSRW